MVDLLGAKSGVLLSFLERTSCSANANGISISGGMPARRMAVTPLFLLPLALEEEDTESPIAYNCHRVPKLVITMFMVPLNNKNLSNTCTIFDIFLKIFGRKIDARFFSTR